MCNEFSTLTQIKIKIFYYLNKINILLNIYLWK